MFAKSISQSDAFLDMPLTTQALYFHLGMEADDDGFLGSAQRTMRMIGASKDDLSLLIAKGFVIALQNGVCVITHWGVNNYIRGDRYKATLYTAEKAMLCTLQNDVYALRTDISPALPTIGIPSGNQTDTIGRPSANQTDTIGRRRLGKDRLGKDSVYGGKPPSTTKKEKAFTPPTLDEVTAYCRSRNNDVDPKRFLDYYEAASWQDSQGKPVKSWKQKMISAWEGRTQLPRRVANEPEYQDLTGIGRCRYGE